MARAKQPKQIHQMTISEWEAAFPDEDGAAPLAEARALLVAATPPG